MAVEVDVIRRIFVEDGNGAFLEIGPDGDGLGCIEIRTAGKESIEWFGAVHLSLSKDSAKAVAQALLAAAAD